MKNSNETFGNRTRYLLTCSRSASTNCATACPKYKNIGTKNNNIGVYKKNSGGYDIHVQYVKQTKTFYQNQLLQIKDKSVNTVQTK